MLLPISGDQRRLAVPKHRHLIGGSPVPPPQTQQHGESAGKQRGGAWPGQRGRESGVHFPSAKRRGRGRGQADGDDRAVADGQVRERLARAEIHHRVHRDRCVRRTAVHIHDAAAGRERRVGRIKEGFTFTVPVTAMIVLWRCRGKGCVLFSWGCRGVWADAPSRSAARAFAICASAGRRRKAASQIAAKIRAIQKDRNWK